MKALKIALLSAAAIGLTAPAFAQTADTSKPAVSTQASPKSDVKADAGKSGATVDSKSNASASTSTDTKTTTAKKSKKHHKNASAAPAKSTTAPKAAGKSST